MKTIKNIQVKVNYVVGVGGYEVSEKVFKQLEEMHNEGKEIDGAGSEYTEAIEWINANVKENDAFVWEYEIEEFK
ncbi:hypothetical protein CXF68_09190 [Tenacibaculum sp. Bg11-29]|uniref:hypothetical protein n=1 Tax=Tenacibaculum sp. Bg11-29 TaxID=2058306 RepID=UPI000C31EDF1|nr:hypothetical protein [Tenacibaculum sp. Bg11-29]PKH50849.1 hypothetical protein CXF68_09190 [Tenacibaculum sp. Bg11-29]